MRPHILAVAAPVLCLLLEIVPISAFKARTSRPSQSFLPSNHTDNHAVILSSSRYWFNYRHVTNALHIYSILKSNGIPDENIILMLADDIPCNARNPYRNKIYGTDSHTGTNLFENVEVDYRGEDVTADNFIRVLLGKHHHGELPSRKLDLTSQTNLLVYLTGHGGDQFFKFQDLEEITAHDFQSIFHQMHLLGRYNEILFLTDTCQAFTLADEITAPNVFSVASSLKDENSYAHHSDYGVGLSVVDRYTHFLAQFVQRRGGGLTGVGLKEALVDSMKKENLRANVGHTDESCTRKMESVPMADFFAAPARRKNSGEEVKVWTEGWEFVDGTIGDEVQRETVPERRDEVLASDTVDGGTVTKKAERQRGGMQPSDPRFVVSVVAMLLAVRLSSRIW